jgi:hypothetical protein
MKCIIIRRREECVEMWEEDLGTAIIIIIIVIKAKGYSTGQNIKSALL